jgi:hypothetical protein
LDESLVIKTDGRKVYLIDEVAGNYEITLPTDSPPQGAYAYLPLSDARIEILPPVSSDAEDAWFVQITNGKFFFTVNGILYKYHITEFLNQSFYPEAPIKSVGTEKSTILAKNLIKLDREAIYQDTSFELYVNIQISKSDGTGVAALTTNPDIVGNIATNGQAWIQWTTSNRYGIKSIDHQTGFVDIEGLSLSTNWEATSSYYYTTKYYEFTLVNFNPISNQNILDQRVVLFIDPDTFSSSKDQTLFYLKVDQTGKVIESNWSEFDNDLQKKPGPPVLPVYYEAFPSWKPAEDHVVFRDEETVEVSGNYLLLGDVTVAPANRPEELVQLDARRRGGGIIDTSIDSLQEDYPELTWFWDVGYWDGIPYPGNASYMVEVPVDIFTGAGGVFIQQEVKDIISQHTAAGIYPVVKAYGVDVTISGIYPDADSITLEWSSDEYEI